MSKLVIETQGLCGWQSRLADPVKHWKRCYSAFELAVSWERAAADKDNESDIPPQILDLLLKQKPELPKPELVVGIVEHKVALPHGRTASQNDLWALVKVGDHFLSLAVEGKAGEDFDDLVSDWLRKRNESRPHTEAKESPTKRKRLDFLLQQLGIHGVDVSDLRYQLLHRTASALIEANRVGAKYAAMIVQSFKNPVRNADGKAHFDDFRRFGERLRASVEEGQLATVPNREGVQLYLGWVMCDSASDAEIAGLYE